MRVFLTGGTGLVGSHVAEQLIGRGDRVRALVRDGSDSAHLKRLGCELEIGNVAHESDELAALMRGCDALVHAAALVGARVSRDVYHDMNVVGTQSTMRAARSAGITRAVHVSSVAVYGPIDGSVLEERWEEQRIHDRAFYASSKRASEIEAWRHDRQDGMRITTVRPALIYGERDRHFSARFDRLLRLPVLPLPDGGRHNPPLVYAGNVAAGIVAALDRPAAPGRAYNLAQDNGLSLREFVGEWCRAREARPPFMPSIPGALIEGAARVLDNLSHRLPALDLPGLTRPARLVRADNPYDSGRARTELGWSDLVPARVAIQRTVDWLASASV